MLVAEAIEEWGRQIRDQLDADQRKQLGAIWTTISDGDLSGFHIESLSKEQGREIMAALGISAEMAECLNRELGNIDSAQADAALLTKPVCGTTLLEVISGIGQG
jgi:hypothetical protein